MLRNAPAVMSRSFLICADDYAQSECISSGIMNLAKIRHINAISCLVTHPPWRELHQELAAVKANCLQGLHLDFTAGQVQSNAWRTKYGCRFRGLRSFIKPTFLYQIPMQLVIAEISAQIDQFTNATGKNPDFIDGHQHVHQFPLIFEALCYIHKSRSYTCFIRNTDNNMQDLWRFINFPKLLTINLLGGFRSKRRLIQEKIPTNSSFAGIYHFKKANNYKTYFQNFLLRTKPNGLIMCHPSLWDLRTNDPLGKARFMEYQYLLNHDHLSSFIR